MAAGTLSISYFSTRRVLAERPEGCQNGDVHFRFVYRLLHAFYNLVRHDDVFPRIQHRRQVQEHLLRCVVIDCPS